METALERLTFRMQELMDNAVDDRTFKDHEADLEEYSTRCQNQKMTILDAIAAADLPDKYQVTRREREEEDDLDSIRTADGHPRQFKANQALKPDKLSPESNPEELRIWLDQYRSYFETSCMEEILMAAQQAYFKQ